FPPAPGQGAIGIETRIGDDRVKMMLAPIHHAPTGESLACERAFLAGLDGSCRTPIAGHARHEGGRLVLDGMILAPDGGSAFRETLSGSASEAVEIGSRLAQELRSRAGPDFLAAWA